MQFSASESQNDCYQLGFLLGAETEAAYYAVDAASRNILHQVAAISDAVLLSEAVSNVKDWQPQILRAYFANKGERLSVDKILHNAVYELQRKVGVAAPVLDWYSLDKVDFDLLQKLLDCAADFIDGVYNLMEPDSPHHDDGESLHSAMSRHAVVDIERDYEKMRELRLRAGGRKAGPTPITEFVLKKTREIRNLHQTRSPGEDYEYFIAYLVGLPAVQEWRVTREGLKGSDLVTARNKQCVEVQAFDLLHGFDRLEGGEKIKQMRDNHPNF